LTAATSAIGAEPPAAAPAASNATADATVVLDDTTLWRLFRVEGAMHVRSAEGLQRRRIGQRYATVVDAGPLTEAFSSVLPPAGWAGPTFDDSAWPRVLLPQPMLYDRLHQYPMVYSSHP
jgi:hypothetical protein